MPTQPEVALLGTQPPYWLLGLSTVAPAQFGSAEPPGGPAIVGVERRRLVDRAREVERRAGQSDVVDEIRRALQHDLGAGQRNCAGVGGSNPRPSNRRSGERSRRSSSGSRRGHVRQEVAAVPGEAERAAGALVHGSVRERSAVEGEVLERALGGVERGAAEVERAAERYGAAGARERRRYRRESRFRSTGRWRRRR